MSAIFSPCQSYRYQLGRQWGAGIGELLFVMLNPSMADAEKDDPTIRRCIGFAKRWGFRSLVVGNLFALRATHPHRLREVADPVGPENDEHLRKMSIAADLTIVAWGNHGAYKGRGFQVIGLLHRVMHLGLTKQGEPKHPLYLPNNVVRLRA